MPGRLVRKYIRVNTLDVRAGGQDIHYSDSVYWDIAIASDGALTLTGVGGTDDDFEIATVSGDIILDAAGKIMLEPTIETAAQYGVGIIPADDITGEYETCLRIDGDIAGAKESRHGAGIKMTIERPADHAFSAWGGSPDTSMMIDMDERAENTVAIGSFRGLQIDLDNYGGINWGKALDISVTNRTGVTGMTSIYGGQINLESFAPLSTLLVGLDIGLIDEYTKPTAEYGIQIRNLNNSVEQYADAAIKIGRVTSNTKNTGFLYIIDAVDTLTPIAPTGGVLNLKDDSVIADANGAVGAAEGFIVICIDGVQKKLRTYALA